MLSMYYQLLSPDLLWPFSNRSHPLIVAIPRLILLVYFLIWQMVLILLTFILESDRRLIDSEERRWHGWLDIKGDVEYDQTAWMLWMFDVKHFLRRTDSYLIVKI